MALEKYSPTSRFENSRFEDKMLRSVGGERGKWSGEQREAFGESLPERNAAAEPQTEACRCCGNLRMPVRDERIFCEAEQARSPSSL
jgi:hypothetical protein